MTRRPVPSYHVLCVLIDEDKVSGFEHSCPKPVLYSHHHTDRSLLHCGPFRSITLSPLQDCWRHLLSIRGSRMGDGRAYVGQGWGRRKDPRAGGIMGSLTFIGHLS